MPASATLVGMDVLQLDISGRPQAWISPREAAILYASDAVAWTLGDTFQVLRGGSFVLDGMYLRNSFRMRQRPDVRTDDIGLRKGKGDPFYGRFQNDGFTAGRTKVPGKGFVQRVFAERKEAAVQLIVRSAEAGAEVVKRKLGLK